MRQEHIEILQTLKALDSRNELTGEFSDIPVDVYHHEESPGYSSTFIKRLVEKSYNHWFLEKQMNQRALEFGQAFHCYVNEPALFNELFEVVPTSNRRSGEWREAKRAITDKILITLDDVNCIKIMADKLYSHPDIGPYMSSATFERTFYSRDAETGLLKKCRIDILSNGIIFDLKSTFDASYSAFQKQMKAHLQRVSSSYYLEILSEVFEARHDDFRLVACEKQEPREIKVYKVPESSIQRAQAEIRVALRTIKDIQDNGASAWKGYQLGAEEIFI